MHRAGRIDRFTLAVLCIALLAAGLTFWWLGGDTPGSGPRSSDEAQPSSADEALSDDQGPSLDAGVEPAPEARPGGAEASHTSLRSDATVPENVPTPGSDDVAMHTLPLPGGPLSPGSSTDDVPAEERAGVRGRVVDSSGRPLAGVHVSIGHSPEFAGSTLALDPAIFGAMAENVSGAEATTDADGRFEILDLHPARAPVLSFKPPQGFLSKRQKAPTLRSGEVVDAGTIHIERPGSIQGVVRDGEGRPIEGALVRLGEPLPEGVQMFHAEGGDGARFMMVQLAVEADSVVEETEDPGEADPREIRQQFPGVARSDAEGRFELTEVRPGQHLVSARLKGYRDARLEPVEVEESATTGPIQLVMAQPLQLLVRVRDQEGLPIEGARVRAGTGRMGGMSFHESPRGSDANSSTTDGSGEVRFADLNDSEIALSVRADGYALHESKLKLSAEGANLREVTLQPAGALRGRVLDFEGKPLAGAQLLLRRLGENPSFAHSFGAGEQTGADGRFVLDGLEPGPHELEVSHDACEDASFGPFAVEQGASLDVGDLRMKAAGSIEVRVVDAAGEPLAGATVSLGTVGTFASISVESDGAALFVSDGMAKTTSDDDGRALLTGVEPGTHTVRAHKDGLGEGFADAVEVLSGGTVQVEISVGQAGRVEGVAKRAGGELHANLDLGLYREGAGMMAVAHCRTDAQGRFVLEQVAPGFYRLGQEMGHDGHGPVFEVRDGATTWQDFEEAARLRIAGKILRADGSPAAGLALSVGWMSPVADGAWTVRWPSAEGYSDEQGRFSFEDVAETGGLGLQVTVSAEERYVYPLDARGPELEALLFMLRHDWMESGASLEVLMLDAIHGQPTPGAILIVSRLNPPAGSPAFRRELAADAEGQIGLEGLEPGNYRLEGVQPGAALEVRDLEMEAVCHYALRIALHPIGHLLFNVRSASGAQGTVRIEATLEGEPDATRVRSGELGEMLTFENLRLGTEYRFEISAPGHVSQVQTLLVRPADAAAVEVQLATGN